MRCGVRWDAHFERDHCGAAGLRAEMAVGGGGGREPGFPERAGREEVAAEAGYGGGV